MGNLQSFWGQIDLKIASQITAVSDGFIDFLKVSKTEWEVKDFIIRKLLHYRFSELSTISKLAPGKGFFESIDERCLVAGVVGTSNIRKRGVSIIGCSIDADSLEIAARNPGVISEMDITTLRFSTASKEIPSQWTSTNVSIHGMRTLRDKSTRSVVLGESRREPGFIISEVPEKQTDKEKKTRKQYDLILGSANTPENGEKKTHYPAAFLNTIGMSEKEMDTAPISLVPSSMPNEIGSDRSMIQGFGAKERLPVYAVLKTLTDLTSPEDTILVIFYSRKGECGKKNHLREITEKSVKSISKKLIENVSEDLVNETLEFSRILEITGLRPKGTKTSQDRPLKPLPVGKGPIIGISGGATKASRSHRLLGIVEDTLEKNSFPHVKLPSGYEFETTDTIGGNLVKDVPEIMYMSHQDVGSRNLSSTVSKLDIWASYKVILTYSTH